MLLWTERASSDQLPIKTENALNHDLALRQGWLKYYYVFWKKSVELNGMRLLQTSLAKLLKTHNLSIKMVLHQRRLELNDVL